MTLAVVVLAGGESRRFGSDKLAAELDGRTVLQRALEGIPAEASVYLVGQPRPVERPVTWLREEPPGGGPAAAMVCGLRAALDDGAVLLAVMPGDAPRAGVAAGLLVEHLRSNPTVDAVVGVDDHGREQPLQVALRVAAARQIIEAAGPTSGSGASARGLIGILEPPARALELSGRDVADIDTPEQLAAWLDRP